MARRLISTKRGTETGVHNGEFHPDSPPVGPVNSDSEPKESAGSCANDLHVDSLPTCAGKHDRAAVGNVDHGGLAIMTRLETR